MPTASWISPSPAAKYGGAFAGAPAATRDDSPLTQVAGPAPDGVGMGKLLHPNNPLFWVGAVLAGAIGLAAVSTTVRVGPARVKASIGGD
jgi:hypothetical protein